MKRKGETMKNDILLKLIIVNHLNTLCAKFYEYFPPNKDPRVGFLWAVDTFGDNSGKRSY
jgi:hypothetical protein